MASVRQAERRIPLARPMTRRGATIAGMGLSIPPHVVTNHDLERLADTSDEWVQSRTGIKERRVASDGVATSDLAVEAAERALAQARGGAQCGDLLLVGAAT